MFGNALHAYIEASKAKANADAEANAKADAEAKAKADAEAKAKADAEASSQTNNSSDVTGTSDEGSSAVRLTFDKDMNVLQAPTAIGQDTQSLLMPDKYTASQQSILSAFNTHAGIPPAKPLTLEDMFVKEYMELIKPTTGADTLITIQNKLGDGNDRKKIWEKTMNFLKDPAFFNRLILAMLILTIAGILYIGYTNYQRLTKTEWIALAVCAGIITVCICGMMFL